MIGSSGNKPLDLEKMSNVAYQDILNEFDSYCLIVTCSNLVVTLVENCAKKELQLFSHCGPCDQYAPQLLNNCKFDFHGLSTKNSRIWGLVIYNCGKALEILFQRYIICRKTQKLQSQQEENVVVEQLQIRVVKRTTMKNDYNFFCIFFCQCHLEGHAPNGQYFLISPWASGSLMGWFLNVLFLQIKISICAPKKQKGNKKTKKGNKNK